MKAGWAEVALGDVCQVVGGGTPKTAIARYWDGDVLWATPKDLSEQRQRHIQNTSRSITSAGLASSGARVLPAGSVLLSSRAPIGLVAINDAPMATNQGFKSLVPNSAYVDPEYLAHWLSGKTKYLQSLGTGATFKEISKRVVEKVAVPLPSLDVQRWIARILDAADAVCDLRREALRHSDRLPAAIFHQMFGDPMIASNGSSRATLAEVVRNGTIVTYGIVQAGDEVPGGVPYIRTGDIQSGKIGVSRLLRTAPEIAARFARSRVETGDIVMSIRATVGTTAIVPADLDGANLTQGTARIAPSDAAQGPYLLNMLRYPSVQRWIQRQVKGATFREITLARLRELPVLLPPRHRQAEFAALDARAAVVIACQRNSLAEIETLRLSLEQRAFAGAL